MAKKNEKKARHDIIVDMNDFLMDYAAVKLGRQPNLAQQVAKAGQPDLTGLDELFKDNGIGRRTKYEEIATGFLWDEEDVNAVKETDAMKQESAALTQEAIVYLGNHAQDFDRWEEA
ncbi:hypothetical protein LZY01_06470 [Levilactobacillus zymae]|uniref:Uncharacterized protein n=1 Tax=Levilactobacillus zymae TaxID=267363 RepID=A0ABQ0WUK2_9LACO|nr:hypothetical protein [Levilactobacillus zymae]KRL11188.1 hypothetical protein FD38_GL001700 [Levilactobacillus zymae DSM 19395]QFR60085.1 hypothetical protein LZ395_00365 [Levilactobacillus zymae]GEO71479.1 hypothetical protein LZY01_06470 [Levilactobacillus zymae]